MAIFENIGMGLVMAAVMAILIVIIFGISFIRNAQQQSIGFDPVEETKSDFEILVVDYVDKMSEEDYYMKKEEQIKR